MSVNYGIALTRDIMVRKIEMRAARSPMGAGWWRRLLLVGAFWLVASVPVALAARPILLESHEQEPPPEVRRLMRVIHDAVARSVDSDAALRPRLEAFYGRAERALSKREVAEIFSGLKTASLATYRGDWAKAISVLSRGGSLLGRDPLSVARRRPLFKALQQIRVLLAMCFSRTGKTDQAWRMLEAALLAEPGLSLPAVFYGPVLQRLYYRVKTQLDMRRGSLRVETYPSGALIFLSGRNVGVSPVTLTGVYQGTYDLLVVRGTQTSRVRRVSVTSRPVSIRVDLAVESPIRTTPFVGLLLSPGARRMQREAQLARDIGRRLGCSRVLLVGLRRWGDRLALVGRSVSVARPRDQALAYVYIEPLPPSKTTLIRLARFLLNGGDPGGGVHVAKVSDGRSLDRLRPRGGSGGGPGHGTRRGRRGVSGLGVAGWTVFALGLAGAAGGGVTLAFDGRTSSPATTTTPRQVYHTRTLGLGVLGGGLGLAAVGAVLLIVDAALGRRGGHDGVETRAALEGRGSADAMGRVWALGPWSMRGGGGLSASLRF